MIENIAQIKYAQGFVEDYIETHAAEAEPDEVEHRKQLLEAWQTVSAGLDALQKENAALQLKLGLIRNAILL